MVSEKSFIPRICVLILSWNHINERSLERLRTHSDSDHMSLTSAGDKLSLDGLRVYSEATSCAPHRCCERLDLQETGADPLWVRNPDEHQPAGSTWNVCECGEPPPKWPCRETSAVFLCSGCMSSPTGRTAQSLTCVNVARLSRARKSSGGCAFIFIA